jgi:hypothetical protein
MGLQSRLAPPFAGRLASVSDQVRCTVVPIIRYRLDRSWYRKHDVREAVRDWGRETLRKMPRSLEKKVRNWLGED